MCVLCMVVGREKEDCYIATLITNLLGVLSELAIESEARQGAPTEINEKVLNDILAVLVGLLERPVN